MGLGHSIRRTGSQNASLSLGLVAKIVPERPFFDVLQCVAASLQQFALMHLHSVGRTGSQNGAHSLSVPARHVPESSSSG